MFRNSIKEVGEPSWGEASLPRRDSLTKLHDIIRSSSVDGYVSKEKLHSSCVHWSLIMISICMV